MFKKFLVVAGCLLAGVLTVRVFADNVRVLFAMTATAEPAWIRRDAKPLRVCAAPWLGVLVRVTASREAGCISMAYRPAGQPLILRTVDTALNADEHELTVIGDFGWELRSGYDPQVRLSDCGNMGTHQSTSSTFLLEQGHYVVGGAVHFEFDVPLSGEKCAVTAVRDRLRAPLSAATVTSLRVALRHRSDRAKSSQGTRE